MIEFKKVRKNIKKNEVIKETTFTFKEGNIYGIYGKNGAGKTIFLKLLCGFYIPTTGEILYDGVNLNKKNYFPNNIGALIGKPEFYEDMTGFENLKLLAKIRNTITEEDINKVLSIVSFECDRKKKLKTYSSGMKQKIAIAQALMEKNKVIVLDDPFNYLDRVSINKIKKFLLKLKKEGKIIVICSHYKEDLEDISNKFLLIDEGVVKKVRNFENI